MKSKMNKKLKYILHITWFVLLFAFIVYMRTTRKLKRTGVIKEDKAGQSVIFENDMKENPNKTYEIERQIEQKKRDSIRQIQQDKLDARVKKTEEILKALEKETEVIRE